MKSLQIQLDLTPAEADMLLSSICQSRTASFGSELYLSYRALLDKVGFAHQQACDQLIDQLIEEQYP